MHALLCTERDADLPSMHRIQTCCRTSTCRLLPEHDECRSERARSSRARLAWQPHGAGSHTLQLWGRSLASRKMAMLFMLQWPGFCPVGPLGDREERDVFCAAFPADASRSRHLTCALSLVVCMFIADNARLRCASWRFATMAPVIQLGFSCPVSALFS
jgi:hypothetical protein